MHMVRSHNHAERKSSQVLLPLLQRIHAVALRTMQSLRTTVPMRKMRFYGTLGDV
jgi:hypothetical protein